MNELGRHFSPSYLSTKFHHDPSRITPSRALTGLSRSRSLMSSLSIRLMSYISHEWTQPGSYPMVHPYQVSHDPRGITPGRALTKCDGQTGRHGAFTEMLAAAKNANVCKMSVIFFRHHYTCINTLRPRPNGRRFADDIFKCIYLNENVWISIKNSLTFVPEGPINNISASVQIMAWRRPGKPLCEPMKVSLLPHICVTRPQWVKSTPIHICVNGSGQHCSR